MRSGIQVGVPCRNQCLVGTKFQFPYELHGRHQISWYMHLPQSLQIFNVEYLLDFFWRIVQHATQVNQQCATMRHSNCPHVCIACMHACSPHVFHACRPKCTTCIFKFCLDFGQFATKIGRKCSEWTFFDFLSKIGQRSEIQRFLAHLEQ